MPEKKPMVYFSCQGVKNTELQTERQRIQEFNRLTNPEDQIDPEETKVKLRKKGFKLRR